MSKYNSNDRPGFLAFLSILMIVASIIGLIASVALADELGRFGSNRGGAVVVLGIIGNLVSLLVGIGLYSGSSGARTFYVVLVIFNFIMLLVSERYDPTIKIIGCLIGLPIAIAILSYLYGTRCSYFFGSYSSKGANSRRWKCTECGADNPSLLAVCESCGQKKPVQNLLKNGSGKQQQEPIQKTAEQISEERGRWMCEKCKTSYANFVKTCSFCGEEKPGT